MWSQGYFEQASLVIEESVTRAVQSENRVAIARAYGVLASIQREQGHFDAMEENRARQGDLIADADGRASYYIEVAMDQARRGNPSAPFPRAVRAARAEGEAVLASRAMLYGCLYESRQQPGRCSLEEARKEIRFLQQNALPVEALDGKFAWAGILKEQGRDSEALETLASLVDDIYFYRTQLGGVLGAWYWVNRHRVFQDYADLSLDAGGSALLLALERINKVQGADGDETNHENLRGELARQPFAESSQGARLNEQVNRRLYEIRNSVPPDDSLPGRSDIEAWQGQLQSDESALVFYFSDQNVYALTADRNSARVTRLGSASNVAGELESLRDQLGSASGPAPIESLDRLGAVLFGPLSGSLKETVFLLPTAMLNGLPVDAFRVNGRYLAERRLLIHANSLASATRLNSLPADYRYSVFLAGNPQAGQDLFSYGVSTSTELANVRDQFVGSGLHMVQGVALHLDEFNDERFSQASLVHLAMPGRVDLAVPERSRLLLSGTREDPSAEFLTAVDIRRFSLSAELAVLTGTAFAERPSSGFASLLGLVDDLHSAGVNLVVATLWPAGDRETARFVADFYSELAVQGDVPAALYSARKKRIESGDSANFRTWAGFQLFIR